MQERHNPRDGAPGGRFGPDAHQRIQAKSAFLAGYLSHCSKRELDMLVRFYIHGQDEDRVAAEMRATPEEFASLRARLRAYAADRFRNRSSKASAASAGR